MIGDVLLEFFAADTLDDVSGESKSIIGIARNFARRKNARWHLVREIGAQRFHVAFVRHEEIFQRLLESARMREQLPQGYRLWIRFRDWEIEVDRKSTRLNSSHITISYAVFCLKKKKKLKHQNM